MSIHLKVFLKLFFIFTGLLTSTNELRSEGSDKLITRFCIEGVKEEMHLAGIETNQNIENFTCDCFLNRIKTGFSITSAQLICKEEVYKKFNF